MSLPVYEQACMAVPVAEGSGEGQQSSRHRRICGICRRQHKHIPAQNIAAAVQPAYMHAHDRAKPVHNIMAQMAAGQSICSARAKAASLMRSNDISGCP